jgi:hypothetical protein
LGHSAVDNTTYAALHPEVEGLNPEDYPDINKLGILADIAPYSREYNRIRAVVDKQANFVQPNIKHLSRTPTTQLSLVVPLPSPHKNSPRARPPAIPAPPPRLSLSARHPSQPTAVLRRGS